MRTLIAAAFIFCSSFAYAEDVIRIDIGKDYSKYSQSDLQRRVWELERAVSQLQSRVFQLEGKGPGNSGGGDTWACTIKAMGDTYTGTGASKAVASTRAVENCKAARGGDGFFCKDPKCEQ